MQTSLSRTLTIALVLALPASTTAVADDAAKAWEDGSTQDQRDRAHTLFSDGNDAFFKRDYPHAIELYEQAVAVFGHPRIHLALARTLLKVGRPADAYPHVVAALRWGAAPLDEEEHAEALELKAALSNQVAVLVVHCRTDGARVTLDGKELPPCSGDERLVVMPGRHQIVAEKPVYLTYTGEAIADAGRETEVDVKLRTLDTVKQRRWKPWKPWAIVGGGVAVALVGFEAWHLRTHNLSLLGADCGTSAGCQPGSAGYEAYSRARLDSGIAISLWSVGGAIAASGVVAAFFNRERVVISKTEGVAISPVIAPDRVGLGVIGRF